MTTVRKGSLRRSDSRAGQRSRHQTEVPSEGADVLLSSGFMAGNSNTSCERTNKNVSIKNNNKKSSEKALVVLVFWVSYLNYLIC